MTIQLALSQRRVHEALEVKRCVRRLRWSHELTVQTHRMMDETRKQLQEKHQQRAQQDLGAPSAATTKQTG